MDAAETPHQQLVRIRDLEARISALRAEQVQVLARYAGRCQAEADADPGPWGGYPDEFAAEDLAAWMTWTTYRAAQSIHEATRLSSCLPATLQALGAGRIDYPRAKLVIAAVEVLDETTAAAVDTAVAPVITDLTTGQLRPVLDREVITADPDAAARRYTRGTTARSIRTCPLGDGLATLTAFGPASTILATREQLRRTARDLKRVLGEDRTLAALEFDLLLTTSADHSGNGDGAAVGAAAGAGSVPVPASGTRTPALVNVTVALPTLLGLDQQPGELTGYGPIPAQLARDLATDPDSTWRRLVIDPVTGTLIGIDGHTHPAQQPPPRTRTDDDTRTPTRTRQRAPGATPPGKVQMVALDAPEAPTEVQHTDPSTDRRLQPVPESLPVPGTAVDRPGPDRTDPEHHAEGHQQDDTAECGPATAGGGPYRPPAWMIRHVVARDPRCTAPGCRQPAHRADLDHITRWPDGPTCPCNLHPLCRRHHRMKHTPGWTITRTPDGTTTWTTPTGLVIAYPAPPVLPRARVTPRPPAERPDSPAPSGPGGRSDESPDADPERHDSEYIRLRRAVHGPPAPPTPPPPTTTWDLDDEPPF